MKSRRTNNEGSVYFDDNLKRYIGQFRYIDPETGKNKRKKITGLRKTEVLQKGKQFIEMNNELLANKKKGRLSEFIHKWLETTVKPTVRQKTYERYEGILRCYIDPGIGDTELGQINREMLQLFFAKLKSNGGQNGKALSSSTVNSTRRLLKTVFDVAVADGVVSLNPVDRTKPMKLEKKQLNIFTEEQYKSLLEAARQHSIMAYLVIRIAFATGFRIGEIFGLEYNAVDFINNTLTVKQTVISTRHGKVLQAMAKNGTSMRTIKVEKELIDELKDFKKIHDQRKAVFKNKYEQNHDFIIENIDGTFCDPSYFTDKIFKRQLLRNAGLPKEFRVHDCRHTHASWLIERGVNIKVVSARLGHKSIRTTLDIYSHITPMMEDEAVNALAGVLQPV